MAKKDFENLLKNSSLKATPSRLAVLRYMDKQHFPVGISRLRKQFPDIDKVTLYRMMDDFQNADLVKGYDIGHGHADYELAGRKHHHHLVCSDCGTIEDVEVCENEKLHKKILRTSKKFVSITDHALTLHGKCKNCL